MIRPWIFEFFTSFAPPAGEAYDAAACERDFAWYVGQWVQAERNGFEGIFFSEHHFVPGRFSPSPNLLIAAIATRTRQLRLGTMGNVVPFYEPWRLAEEYAMLDQLSGGRLEIGFASGSGPMEFRAIGMSGDTLYERFTESLEVIDAALTQPEFSHHGRHWQFERLRIAPRPRQQPAPPRWMTGLSVPTATLAASRGYRFSTGFISQRAVRRIFAAHNEAARAAGFAAGPDQLGLRRMVYVDDDGARGAQLALEARVRLQAIMKSFTQDPNAAAGSVPDAPNPKRGAPEVADEESIGGTPAQVAEQIIAQCRECGAGHFLAYLPGALTREQAGRALQLWAEVIPLLRRASVPALAPTGAGP